MTDEPTNAMKFVIVKLLNGNVVIDGKTIPVLTWYGPDDDVDCIGQQLITGGEKRGNIISDVLNPLPEDHPYYDPENPGELYATQSVKSRTVNSTDNLHIWANTPEKRDYIVHEVNRILDEALMFNYKYCVNLTAEQHCKTTNKPCDALTNKNALGIQGKCPYADVEDITSLNYRGPKTWFTLAGISTFSIEVMPEQGADITTVTPEVYHSVIPVDYEMEVLTVVDVNPAIAVDLTNMDIDQPAKQATPKNKWDL